MHGIAGENEGCRGSRFRLWQNALPIQKLRELGLDDERLRLLMTEGYVEHGVETTRPGDAVRRFRWGARLPLCDRSCFILSRKGEPWAARLSRPTCNQ
jgi:hypothetical protein